MQIVNPNPTDRRDRASDLAVLSGTRELSPLAAIAARSGFEAAMRAYDAGLTTPVIKEPGE